jgi:hypothetical protein
MAMSNYYTHDYNNQKYIYATGTSTQMWTNDYWPVTHVASSPPPAPLTDLEWLDQRIDETVGSALAAA